jgi:hypothetical protein
MLQLITVNNMMSFLHSDTSHNTNHSGKQSCEDGRPLPLLLLPSSVESVFQRQSGMLLEDFFKGTRKNF